MTSYTSLIRAQARSLTLPRLLLLTAGLFLFALGIDLTLESGLGLGPWDVLHQGLSLHLPLTFGQAGILVGALLLFAGMRFGQLPGIGTVANMLFIGLFIDLILWTGLLPDLTHAPLAARLALDVLGIAAIGVGSALYIKAGLGAGPRDGLMLALHRVTRLRIGMVRAGLELTVLLAGYLLGGTVGIGTVVFALGIGVAVDIAFRVFRVRTARPVPLPADVEAVLAAGR